MQLIEKIREKSKESLIDSKLQKSEKFSNELKRLTNKLIKCSQKAEKTELCRISNYEVFVVFLNLLNDEKDFSYEEAISHCEEIKRTINSWTYEKNASSLATLERYTNVDGSLADFKCYGIFSDLGLTPAFINYQMKFVYAAMFSFLELKKEILNPGDYYKKLPLTERIKVQKNIYNNSVFSNLIKVIKDSIDEKENEYKKTQEVLEERIKYTEIVLEKIENETLSTIDEIPIEWHIYLDPSVLELLYELVQFNLVKKNKTLKQEKEQLLSEINKSDLTKYLFDNKLNPYSLEEEKLSMLESIPNVITIIEFLRSIGLPLNNILTVYYNELISLTEEKINKLNILINQNALKRETIKENIKIIINDYEKIINNYNILKNIIDFSNIFYNSKILFEDIRNIKNIISVLKEYKLTKNNYIYLLCNYEYLYIYDLIIENEIPEHLFISICETEKPYNTIKRILIYRNIGEEYETPSHFLRKELTSEERFICDDESLDEYLPNIVAEQGLNILRGNQITYIKESNLVKKLDDEYQVDDVYFIGNINISKPKFLRNFECVQGNEKFLILSLISGSILDEKSYFDLCSELSNKKIYKKM